MTAWQSEHFLEVFEHATDQWVWACACGHDGSARNQLLAGESYRAHVTEAQVAA